MAGKKLPLGLLLLLLVQSTISIDLRFWKIFYGQQEIIKTPYENLISYDRDQYQKDLNSALEHLLVLSETVNEVKGLIDKLKLHGGETIQAIGAILTYNDYVSGAKDEDNIGTSSGTSTGIAALMNSKNKTNSTANASKTTANTNSNQTQASTGHKGMVSFENNLEAQLFDGLQSPKQVQPSKGWLLDRFSHLHSWVRTYYATPAEKKTRAFIAKTKENPFFRPFSKSSHDLVPMVSQIQNKIAAISNATKAPAPVPYAPTKGTKQKIESWEDFLEIGQNTMKDLAAMGPIAVNMLDTNRKIIEKLRGLPPAATI